MEKTPPTMAPTAFTKSMKVMAGNLLDRLGALSDNDRSGSSKSFSSTPSGTDRVTQNFLQEAAYETVDGGCGSWRNIVPRRRCAICIRLESLEPDFTIFDFVIHQ